MATVFIVPHTHWDREWYDREERFRQRLVPVVDDVLDALESDPSARFLLDGQLALVDDYLALRPDAVERVRRAVAAGQLAVGPWYVLADELLVTDETLVRNLLFGRARAEVVGGAPLPVGYSPDAFGHPAALPSILAGFGIEAALVWRGYGGEPGQDRDLFRWRGPDGSTVVTHHLPPAGYEFGAELPAEPDALAARWGELREMFSRRARGDAWLVLNGADHHARQPDLARVLDALRAANPELRFEVATPAEYFAAVDANDVAVVEGELRFSYRYTWTLQGVHATRAAMKRVIAEGERLLTRWVEPQCALSSLTHDAPVVRDLWRRHLLSCAHDSIGGCCADDVARDVYHRADAVRAGAEALWRDALHDRIGIDATRARRTPDAWTPTVAIVNPSPRPRSEIVEAAVTFPARPVAVGRAAPVPPARSRPPFRLLAPDGGEIPYQLLGESLGAERLDSARDYPRQDEVHEVRVACRVPDVPPFGVACIRVVQEPPASSAEDAIAVEGVEIATAWGRLAADDAGGFRLDPPDGAPLRSIGTLRSERDAGDTYTYQPVAGDEPVDAQWGPAEVAAHGPLMAGLRRPFAVADRVDGTLTAWVVSGSPVVRLAVAGVNRAGHHRVRLAVPLVGGPRDADAVADMHFGPVVRRRQTYDIEAFPREWPVTTAPAHRYVSVTDRNGVGATVMLRGTYEYEHTADALLVTILRAVGELSRPDLPARPGHAGWPMPTPEAQELGPFAVEVGALFRGVAEGSPPSVWADVEDLADAWHAPLTAVMMRHAMEPPPRVVGPRLEGVGLVFKSLKRGEAGGGMVARCVNPTNVPIEGRWRWPTPLARACRVRLDESEGAEIGCTEGGTAVTFTAGPREIVTVKVWPA